MALKEEIQLAIAWLWDMSGSVWRGLLKKNIIIHYSISFRELNDRGITKNVSRKTWILTWGSLNPPRLRRASAYLAWAHIDCRPRYFARGERYGTALGCRQGASFSDEMEQGVGTALNSASELHSQSLGTNGGDCSARLRCDYIDLVCCNIVFLY